MAATAFSAGGVRSAPLAAPLAAAPPPPLGAFPRGPTHSFRCTAQCARWHSVLQYFTCLHLLHRNLDFFPHS